MPNTAKRAIKNTTIEIISTPMFTPVPPIRRIVFMLKSSLVFGFPVRTTAVDCLYEGWVIVDKLCYYIQPFFEQCIEDGYDKIRLCIFKCLPGSNYYMEGC